MTDKSFKLHNIQFKEGTEYRDFYDETDESNYERIQVHLQTLKTTSS
jgi:hypothetical protein